ncbi:hypothetical protein GCM10009850_049100 [Nonomuraea monospora]|uniref:Major facilitator superfamily (MFS) profile domain-containing protein n=1 Tax=Nonomuraea monospora TaxID=568818 RepID=A0ABP5PCN0_9ACTN
MLTRYMAGAVMARTGDEMSGPALLVTGLAVTGSPLLASSVLAGLTVSAAIGGPLLGVLLDRARRPGWVLGWCLAGYAAGLMAVVGGMVEGVPGGVLVGVAVVTGLLGPALTGGWTAQLPLVVAGSGGLGRATAFDSMSYNVAGLAGPALVGVIASVGDRGGDAGGGVMAVMVSVGLLIVALPAALGLPSARVAASPGASHKAASTDASPRALPDASHRAAPVGTSPATSPRPPSAAMAASPSTLPDASHEGADAPPAASSRPPSGGVPSGGQEPSSVGRRAVGGWRVVRDEVRAGFRAIVSNGALRRATAASMVSCCGLAMMVVSAPVLGGRVSGGSGLGALLLAVTAAAGLVANAVLAVVSRRGGAVSRWEGVQAAGTAVLGVGMVVMAVSETYWMAVVGAAVAGVGEGPQLTALFAVRHREAPARLRGQVFTTGASLKITSFAIGSALAGPLAAYSVSLALLAGAALQALAVAVLIAPRWADVRRSAGGG